MITLTIIPSDSAIYVDRECRAPVDLATMGIPPNVHALQWYEETSYGWIEFVEDLANPNATKPPNQPITELPPWAANAVQIWENSGPIDN